MQSLCGGLTFAGQRRCVLLRHLSGLLTGSRLGRLLPSQPLAFCFCSFDQRARKSLPCIELRRLTGPQEVSKLAGAESQRSGAREVHEHEITVVSKRAAKTQSANSLRLLNAIPLSLLDPRLTQGGDGSLGPVLRRLSVQHDGCQRFIGHLL